MPATAPPTGRARADRGLRRPGGGPHGDAGAAVPGAGSGRRRRRAARLALHRLGQAARRRPRGRPRHGRHGPASPPTPSPPRSRRAAAPATAGSPRAQPRRRRPVDPAARGERPGPVARALGSGRSGGADPLLGAVGEDLVLPDRHLGLERVDERPGGVEGSPRWAAVVATTTAMSPIAERPVRCTAATAVHVVLLGDLRADLAQPGLRGRVGGVVQAGRRPGRRRGRGPGRRTGSARRSASSSSAAITSSTSSGGLAERRPGARRGRSRRRSRRGRSRPRRPSGTVTDGRVRWTHERPDARRRPPTSRHEHGREPLQGHALRGAVRRPAAFGAGGQMPDLSALFGQMQSMMQPLRRPDQLGRRPRHRPQARSPQEPDPTPTPAPAGRRSPTRVRLADHWLDDTTDVRLRRHHDRGLEPGGVDRRHHRRVEGARRAGRRAARSARMASALPEEARAMAGPLLGMLGKAVGAMFATQVGSGARRPGRRGAQRLRHRPAARPGRQGGAGAGQRRGVRRGPRRHRRRRAALPRAARGRPPAAVRPRAVAARPPASAPSPTTPAASRSTSRHPEPIEEQMRGLDPTNPESISRTPSTAGIFEPPQTPAQKAALERLEITLALVEGWVDEVVGQATAERMPAAGQAAGGGPPPARRRRTGRGDLRRAGRPRAAAAPAARRLHPVGLAAHPAGHRGPRRRLDAPRPAAHRRRPRRPAGLPRGRHRARGAHRRRVRRRAAPAARRRRAGGDAGDDRRGRDRRHRRLRGSPGAEPARRRAGHAARPGRRPTPPRTALRGRYVAHLARAPRRDDPGLLPRPPDRRRRWCSRATATRCCSTCTARRAAGSPSAVTASPGTRPWPARRCARRTEESGLADLRLDPVPVHLDEHRSTSATRAGPCTTSTSASSRWPRAGAEHAVSEESLDVRWWPVDELPELEAEMRRLIAGCAAAPARRRDGRSDGSSRPAGRVATALGSVERRRRRRGWLEVRGRRPAEQVALGPLGLGVAVHPGPEPLRCGRPRAGARARGRARSRSPTRASRCSRAESRIVRSPGVHEPQRDFWLSTQRTDVRHAPGPPR